MGGVPLLSSVGSQELPSLLVRFKDGTAATLDDLGEKMRGRHLDQIDHIEVFPSGGQRVDGNRGPMMITGLTMDIPQVPFGLWVMFPSEAAAAIGRVLSAPVDPGLRPPPGAGGLWTPGG